MKQMILCNLHELGSNARYIPQRQSTHSISVNFNANVHGCESPYLLGLSYLRNDSAVMQTFITPYNLPFIKLGLNCERLLSWATL